MKRYTFYEMKKEVIALVESGASIYVLNTDSGEAMEVNSVALAKKLKEFWFIDMRYEASEKPYEILKQI